MTTQPAPQNVLEQSVGSRLLLFSLNFSNLFSMPNSNMVVFFSTSFSFREHCFIVATNSNGFAKKIWDKVWGWWISQNYSYWTMSLAKSLLVPAMLQSNSLNFMEPWKTTIFELTTLNSVNNLIHLQTLQAKTRTPSPLPRRYGSGLEAYVCLWWFWVLKVFEYLQCL